MCVYSFPQLTCDVAAVSKVHSSDCEQSLFLNFDWTDGVEEGLTVEVSGFNVTSLQYVQVNYRCIDAIAFQR